MAGIGIQANLGSCYVSWKTIKPFLQTVRSEEDHAVLMVQISPFMGAKIEVQESKVT